MAGWLGVVAVCGVTEYTFYRMRTHSMAECGGTENTFYGKRTYFVVREHILQWRVGHGDGGGEAVFWARMKSS